MHQTCHLSHAINQYEKDNTLTPQNTFIQMTSRSFHSHSAFKVFQTPHICIRIADCDFMLLRVYVLRRMLITTTPRDSTMLTCTSNKFSFQAKKKPKK